MVRIPIETAAVDFFRPSAEDLAVMKLYSWRKQDQIDLTSAEMLAELDFDLLDHLVYDEDEAKASSLTSLAYRKMLEVYEGEFKPNRKSFPHCGVLPTAFFARFLPRNRIGL